MNTFTHHKHFYALAYEVDFSLQHLHNIYLFIICLSMRGVFCFGNNFPLDFGFWYWTPIHKLAENGPLHVYKFYMFAKSSKAMQRNPKRLHSALFTFGSFCLFQVINIALLHSYPVLQL